MTRATFWCIAHFADVSGFCVIVFFLFLARVGKVTDPIQLPLERCRFSGNFGIRHCADVSGFGDIGFLYFLSYGGIISRIMSIFKRMSGRPWPGFVNLRADHVTRGYNHG